MFIFTLTDVHAVCNLVDQCTLLVIYHIMQIVRGGKVSRLADLSVIRVKTFAIVQQFETPYNKKDKNLLENLRDWRLIRENHESFPPRTICIIRYITVCTPCV